MFLNFSRRAESRSEGFSKWFWKLEADRSKRHESFAALHSQLGFCVSSIDTNIIGSEKVKTIHLGLDVPPLDENIKITKGSIVFSGNLNYDPNIAAITWFLENCWSTILKRVPHATFHVIGRGSSANFIGFVSSFKSVHFVGEVLDMNVELRKYDVAVAPMISGSGMQFKILEAMSAGLPVITTKIGLGDIKAVHMNNIVVSEGGNDVTLSVVKLLSEPLLHKKIGINGHAFVQRQHSWSKINDQFMAALKTARII